MTVLLSRGAYRRDFGNIREFGMSCGSLHNMLRTYRFWRDNTVEQPSYYELSTYGQEFVWYAQVPA